MEDIKEKMIRLMAEENKTGNVASGLLDSVGFEPTHFRSYIWDLDRNSRGFRLTFQIEDFRNLGNFSCYCYSHSIVIRLCYGKEEVVGFLKSNEEMLRPLKVARIISYLKFLGIHGLKETWEEFISNLSAHELSLIISGCTPLPFDI